MSWFVVILLGLSFQLICLYVAYLIFDRFLCGEGRNTWASYAISLFLGQLIVSSPLMIAVLLGVLSATTGMVICGVGFGISSLALVANAGNIVESMFTTAIMIWLAIVMIPLIHAAREREIRKKERQQQKLIHEKASNVPSESRYSK